MVSCGMKVGTIGCLFLQQKKLRTAFFLCNLKLLGYLVFQVKIWMKTNILLVLTILGVFIGSVAGFTFRLMKPSQETIEMVFFPGEMLMRMLKMLILPLIISSLVTG
jgi:Na+/H+-dicarboxylate symporter